MLHCVRCLSLIINQYDSNSSSSGDSKLQCPECRDELCGRCKTLWHSGLSCETAQKWAAADGGGSTDAAALKALATQVSVVLLVMAFLTNSACSGNSFALTSTSL
jgi:IBR domain, a half RING-finger domain